MFPEKAKSIKPENRCLACRSPRSSSRVRSSSSSSRGILVSGYHGRRWVRAGRDGEWSASCSYVDGEDARKSIWRVTLVKDKKKWEKTSNGIKTWQPVALGTHEYPRLGSLKLRRRRWSLAAQPQISAGARGEGLRNPVGCHVDALTQETRRAHAATAATLYESPRNDPAQQRERRLKNKNNMVALLEYTPF
jgi:hypothetical protein